MRIQKSVAALLNNPLGLLGSVITTMTGVLIVTLIAVEYFSTDHNPYVGIITYMILPTVFGFGLLLMIVGILRHRRSGREMRFPIVDLNVAMVRRRLMTFVVLTCTSTVVLATTTFKAIEYMENPVFCGEVCHTVMEPEYTAYKSSPHASVHCVECHVGPGAGGFIEAKLNGTKQLLGVTFNTYDRPVATPVHNLPSPEVTCQHCHWPGKYHGVLPRMITRFGDDEANTPIRTILLMNVGGSDSKEFSGIHWHADPSNRIRFRSDPKREKITDVEWTRADGTVVKYSSLDAEPDEHAEWRTMDCIDCHNRPAHEFQEAEEAVDLAMERGFIRNDLPFIRRESVRALRGGFESREEAHEGIAESVRTFYDTQYPAIASERDDELESTINLLYGMYDRNVFPKMDVDWGTYPDHIGHTSSPGCFRCHSGSLATSDGDIIGIDCRMCHTIMAWDEASPDILEMVEQRRRMPPSSERRDR